MVLANAALQDRFHVQLFPDHTQILKNLIIERRRASMPLLFGCELPWERGIVPMA